MLIEKIETLLGVAPASVQDLVYVFAFIFMIWLCDKLVGLLVSFFNR